MPRTIEPEKAGPVDFASLILRLPLGVFLIWTGVQRFIGARPPMATDSVLGGSRLTSFPWVTPEVLGQFAQALPYTEFLVGCLLCAGLLTRCAAAVLVLLMAAMSVLLGWGDPSEPFSPRLIYLSIAGAVLLLGPGMLSADFVAFGAKKNGKR